MKSCTCACWSVAPSAASGVDPTDVPSGRFFPRLSAQSWTNHAAKSRNGSEYGMKTAIDFFSRVSESH